MNKPHKHAERMLQYAQDAMETEMPWGRWEFRLPGTQEWRQALSEFSWLPGFEFRRKPRTININGIEVPEPMREKPENEAQYFYFEAANPDFIGSYAWKGDNFDNRLLKSGFIHATLEAAELHAKALLSFTKK